MKDELISFETAKLAKEKGFNVDCVFKYYNIKEHIEILYGSGKYWEDVRGKKIIPERIGVLSEYKLDNNVGSFNAPTQSLLQRWLREVHGTSIELHFGMRGCGSNYLGWYHADIHGPYGGGLATTVNYTKTDTYPKENLTYEQCLEKCLLEGLNLIKL